MTTITTERLIVRRLREEDRQAMIEIHTDPRTNRFDPDPPDADRAGELVTAWLDHWAEHGFGYGAVTEVGAATVIGLTGVRLRDFHGEEVLNLGYRFRPEVWGRGYAVEAARGVLSWRAGTLPGTPVLATIDVANQSSLRVAERIGFREYTEEVHLGAPARHYRL